MAYARPFGQQQAASPWSAGVPPGLQQQQQPSAGGQASAQQIFNQPMGPFDLSAAWQGQQQQASVVPPQVANNQWVPQPMQQMQAPMQFVPNSGAFMQPMQMHHQPHHQQRYHQQQQQRVQNHQRSLSAPRIGGVQNNNKRAGGNQNSSFGSSGQRQYNNNNNNNSNNNQAQRTGRQQARQGNQKVQFSNNNSNNNSNSAKNNNNSNSNNAKQQNQKQQQQQQQSKGPVKVTKAAKKQALVDANRGPIKNNNRATNSNKAGNKVNNGASDDANKQQQPKPQSKTAERKQLKLQARKNAEALEKSSLPVVKNTKSTDQQADAKDEPPIDQSQLKCVPAVFGFVCKLCDVFLRDRAARREHVDLEDHMQKFKVFEEEQQRLALSKSEEAKSESVDDSQGAEKPAESVDEDNKAEPASDADAEAIQKSEQVDEAS